MNVFQPTKIIPEAKWISSILLFLLRLSPKLNECLPSYYYPQSYMNVFILLRLSLKPNACLPSYESNERWIQAEGKMQSSLKTLLHTGHSDVTHSFFLMGEELESSRFLTPDSPLLVPAPFFVFGPSTWNDIPLLLRQIPSLDLFKSNLISFFLQNYWPAMFSVPCCCHHLSAHFAV